MTWNDRPIRTTEAHIRAGAIQPLTAVAVTLPATPSRAEAPLRTIQVIAHHGSAANTLNSAADTLRSSFFMGPPSALCDLASPPGHARRDRVVTCRPLRTPRESRSSDRARSAGAENGGPNGRPGL